MQPFWIEVSNSSSLVPVDYQWNDIIKDKYIVIFLFFQLFDIKRLSFKSVQKLLSPYIIDTWRIL